MLPAPERRSGPRFTVDYIVFFHYLLPNRPTTRMIDLSMEGAAVEALDALPVGSQTSFVFAMNEQDVIECFARVISVVPLTDCKYRVGVSFVGLTANGRQLVTLATQSAALMK